MSEFAIGPFVLSGERLIWILSACTLYAAAFLASRKGRPKVNTWAFRATVFAFIGARMGFVLQHTPVYFADPLSIFAVWQGGFSLWGGVLGFAAITVLHLSWQRDAAFGMAAASLVAISMAFILTQLSRGDQRSLPQSQSFATLAGDHVQLEGPAVINLWASWCPPCRREMPMMVQEAQDNPDMPIYFVNQGESSQTIQSYVNREGLNLSPLVDPAMGLMAHFSIVGLPATLFVDAQGRITHSHYGEISRAALRQGMNHLKR